MATTRRTRLTLEDVAQLGTSASSPAAGYSVIYPKTDGNWYSKNSDGTEYQLNRIAPTSGSGDFTPATDITWNGTTPSGTIVAKYKWSKDNGWCDMTVIYTATVAGVTNTTVQFKFLAGFPTPIDWLTASNGDKAYPATGWIDTAISGNPPATRCTVSKDAGGSWVLNAVGASSSAKTASVSARFPCN